MKRVYTRIEAAEILQVSPSTLQRLTNSRQIFFIRVGRQIRIPADALEDYLQGRAPLWPEGYTEPDLGTWPPTPSLLTGGEA